MESFLHSNIYKRGNTRETPLKTIILIGKSSHAIIVSQYNTQPLRGPGQDCTGQGCSSLEWKRQTKVSRNTTSSSPMSEIKHRVKNGVHGWEGTSNTSTTHIQERRYETARTPDTFLSMQSISIVRHVGQINQHSVVYEATSCSSVCTAVGVHLLPSAAVPSQPASLMTWQMTSLQC